MRQSTFLLLGCALVVSATGCGARVEIPPAHVGVIMNSSGVVMDVKGPSSFRLPVDWFGSNPHSVVILEQSDQPKEGSMKLFMPLDQMIMDFDYRGRFSIETDKEKLKFTLSRMPALEINSRTDGIDFEDVWDTYGHQITITTIRSVLSQYSIAYVTKNRETVNERLHNALVTNLSSTPITCAEFGLSEVQPPELIVQAQQLAKEREIAISGAIASKMVRITEAQSDFAVAQKEQMNDLLEADTQRQVALQLSKGVNGAFLTQRSLQVLEQIAGSDDRIIVYPKEALNNPSLMMAINQTLLTPQTRADSK